MAYNSETLVNQKTAQDPLQIVPAYLDKDRLLAVQDVTKAQAHGIRRPRQRAAEPGFRHWRAECEVPFPTFLNCLKRERIQAELMS